MNKEEQNNSIEKAGKKKKKFSRRKFFKRAGIVLGTTVIGVYLGRNFIRTKVAQFSGDMDLPLGIFNMEPDFWFEVQEDNKVLLKLAKMEMGQGVFTGAAMIAAEELGVPVEQINVQPASTKNGPKDMAGTGGSSSTLGLYIPLREVAATMREMLKTAAAKKWAVDINTISVENGLMTSGTNQMTYAEITKQTTEWVVPKTPALKPSSEFKYIGTERKRVDLVPKVMGDAIFGIDMELPEMLYATILYPPYIGGTLKSVDTSEAESHQGVVKVVKDDNWIGVIAQNRFASVMGSRKLKAEWEVPKKWQQAEIEEAIKPENGVSYVQMQNDGNIDILNKEGEDIFSQTYTTPIGVHAQMEPNGTIAHVEGDKALIITGTQWADRVQDNVASAIGIKKDNVEIKTTFLGGGFGGRYFLSTAPAAAKLSKAVGKPVHLLRTREEEFQNRYFRPPSNHRLSAKVGDDGTILAINHVMSSADMAIKSFAGDFALTLVGADFASTGHGTRILYNFKNRYSKVINCELPFPTGIWRGVGQFPNSFAVECFIDELAKKTGKDPIQFRIDHLTDTENPVLMRCKKALETLAEKSGWQSPKAPETGRGIALCEDRKSIAVAMIEVQKVSGKIKVTRVVQVIDPGMIINPEGVRMQVEGATMMGISAGMFEATYVKDGQFTASNYHQYPMAMLSDTPEIEVIFIEGSDKPYGVGEGPIGPVAPALANAVFDLTGERIRSLPLVKD
jgi:isoquinoline 1-oxidoreductase subunit beta